MSNTLGSRRLRALWATLSWSLLGVGSYIFGVQSTIGQQAEASVLEAAQFTTDPPAPLNLVSIPSVAITLLLIGVFALFVHGIVRAVGLVTISTLAILSSQLLKRQLLDRPELFELDAANTFPSGHMTVFTVLVAAIIWAVPTASRALVTIGGAVLLSAVGWQLLAYGWHRPSDVLGAVALGVAAFGVATVIRPAASSGSPSLFRPTSVGMVIVSWTLIAAAAALALIATLISNQSLMLSAGQFGVIGTSILAARSLLRLSS